MSTTSTMTQDARFVRGTPEHRAQLWLDNASTREIAAWANDEGIDEDDGDEIFRCRVAQEVANPSV